MMERVVRLGRGRALAAVGLPALLMCSCSGDSPLGPSMGRETTAPSRKDQAAVSASAPRSSSVPDAGSAPADAGPGSKPVNLWTRAAEQGAGEVGGIEGSPGVEDGAELAVDHPEEPVYATVNNPPVMRLRTRPAYGPGSPYPVVTGPAPLSVTFNLCKSSDPDQGDPDDEGDGDSLNWQFHFGDDGSDPFDADGTFNANFARACRTEHTYGTGTYVATVTVTDKHLEDQSRDVTGLARVTERLTVVVGPSVPASCSNRRIALGFEGLTGATLPSPQVIGGVSFTSSNSLVGLSGLFTSLPGFSLATSFAGPLGVNLPSPRAFYSFRFATSNLGLADSLRVDGFLEGALAFSDTFPATPPATGFPEGSASGSGRLFDSLVLTSAAGSAVAIDDLGLTCS